MFASSSRLDLKSNIIVGPKKPSHIKTILSGHFPILSDYWSLYRPWDITGSVIWRMRAHLNIVIACVGSPSEGGIMSTTKYSPGRLIITFLHWRAFFFFFPCIREAYIPATCLRGPDQSDLRLRRLTRLYGPSLASISGLLLTATALTDLTLDLISNPAASHSSQGLFLLACLQGTPCLRSLDLTVTRLYDYRDSRSQRPTPKDIVPLTRSHYFGLTVFLNNLMSRLSAPSLQEHQCTRYWQQAGREAAAWYLS
jgi:hypothetical protein